MKKLLSNTCLFVVTTFAIVAFIAPTVFGQEKKTANAGSSPADFVTARVDKLPARWNRPFSSGSAGSRGGKKVYYVWEGEIVAKRVHNSADGIGNWIANYQVRLREDCFGVVTDVKYCALQPLELKYVIEANEVLDKDHFGIYPAGNYSGRNDPSAFGYPGVPHNRSVTGKASGVLRLGENAPDEGTLVGNLHGGIHKDKQAPRAPSTNVPADPDESAAERYWQSCLQAPESIGQPAYVINIDMTSGYGSDDSRSSNDAEAEVLNPLLKGIVRSGPDLQEGKGNLVERSGYARPVLEFTLCGTMKSPDDKEISGEHAFSSTSNQIDQLFGAPTQVTISWKLTRRQVDVPDPKTTPEKPEKPENPQPGATLAPADLALKAEPAPDKAKRGEKFTYKFEIKNNGPADAQGVIFTFSLGSANLILATASQGQCSGTPARVTCRLGRLSADGTTDVTLQLMPRLAGVLRNAARVYSASPDLDPSNNVENVTIRIGGR